MRTELQPEKAGGEKGKGRNKKGSPTKYIDNEVQTIVSKVVHFCVCTKMNTEDYSTSSPCIQHIFAILVH